jgi:Protein of unknown function (DUF3592)
MTLLPNNPVPPILEAIGRLLRDPGALWAILLMLIGAIAPWWRKLRRAILGAAAENWPVVPASIDVVSVVERADESKKVSHIATLTYFYRNPDLQMGEYEREFPLKAVAESWVAQFKSRQVMVRVNPKHPEESVLPDAAIEGLSIRVGSSLEQQIRMERIPELPRGYRLLSGICELFGIIGLAASAIMLVLYISHGGRTFPRWMPWTAAAILALTVVCSFVVELRIDDEGEYGDLLRSYSNWCPAWMRWSLKLSGVLFAVWFLFSRLEPGLARHLLMGRAPLLGYALLCWGFLVTTSTHLAIARSHEQSRPPVGERDVESAASAR